MRKNILIVEDNKAAAEMLQRTIEEMGRDINVYIAHNSMEAYEKALQHTIDIFFLDIILNTGQNGDVSGLEFAQSDIGCIFSDRQFERDALGRDETVGQALYEFRLEVIVTAVSHRVSDPDAFGGE